MQAANVGNSAKCEGQVGVVVCLLPETFAGSSNLATRQSHFTDHGHTLYAVIRCKCSVNRIVTKNKK